MTVAITGATGVVGGAVLTQLRKAGHHVKALVRSEEAGRALGVEAVIGSLENAGSLRALVDGADTVYHVAGRNEMCPIDRRALYRVNVNGTEAVLAALRATSCGRLVYTSSAATIGEPAGIIGTEETPHRASFTSHYERSKYQAEQVVASATDIDRVIVNPSSVQGPGRATGTGKLILDLVNGKLPALVRTRVSIVDIEDCALAHLLAAEKGKSGERYLISGFSLEIGEAVGIAEEILGRSLPVRWLPASLASVAAGITEIMFRTVRRKPPFCREMVRTLRHGHTYDGSKATRELGLTYRSPQDTMSRLLDWFRSQGLLIGAGPYT